MKGKNNAKTQEKARMSHSKLLIHWCKRESQLKPFNVTCLKIVARGESRATRDSGFCDRACRGKHHCNKCDKKSNILTIFSRLRWCLASGAMQIFCDKCQLAESFSMFVWRLEKLSFMFCNIASRLLTWMSFMLQFGLHEMRIRGFTSIITFFRIQLNR
jgi:hypothetical protein